MIARLPYRCHRCDAVLPSYAAAERHADTEHGAARLEAVVEQPELEPAPRRCRVETITVGEAL